MKKIHNQIKISLSLTAAIMALALALSSCTTKTTAGQSITNSNLTAQSVLTKSSQDEVTVMTFNVENLFDTLHDENREDYSFLPLNEKQKKEVQEFCNNISSSHFKRECLEKNWDENAVKFKMSQIAKTIKYVDNGAGPDIIFFAEVENLRILNRLNDEYLKDMGYKTRVLLEGPDMRGIDPAIISKYPIKGKPKLHLIPFKNLEPDQLQKAQKLRGILEVTVTLPNKKNVTLLAVHFASQASPTELRLQSAQFLKEKMLEYEKAGRAVIAAGDMNTIDVEDKSHGIFSNILSQAGGVSHLVGCKSCDGTHNYKGNWSFLDVIVFGNKLSTSGYELIPESLTVVKTPDNSKPNGTPLRFDENNRSGVADHFPLFAKLKIKK